MTAAAATERPADNVVVLGRGTPAQRAFRIVGTRTLVQDVWMIRVCEKAGLSRATLPPGLAEGDPATERFLTDVVSRVFHADAVCELLAAALVEVGQKWTEHSAVANAAYFGEIEDGEDKKTLLGLLAQVIAGFIVSGRSS